MCVCVCVCVCVYVMVVVAVVEGRMEEIPSKHKNCGEAIGNQKKRLFPWGSDKKIKNKII